MFLRTDRYGRRDWSWIIEKYRLKMVVFVVFCLCFSFVGSVRFDFWSVLFFFLRKKFKTFALGKLAKKNIYFFCFEKNSMNKISSSFNKTTEIHHFYNLKSSETKNTSNINENNTNSLVFKLKLSTL